MGTTSEKLTYLNNTKQLLKDKINNLGGSIDEHTTFRQYANQLQTIYDNLPKTEYQEGTEVNLGKTIKGKLDFEEDNGKKVVGIGQSEQDSTNGHQLWQPYSYTKETNGITFTFYTNGEIKVNGTATANALSMLSNESTSYQFELQAGTYILSGAVADFKIQIINSNGTLVCETAYNELEKTFILSETTNVFLRCQVNSGKVINNVIIKPMLETGSTAHDWEPYSGGYQSPSPNWQQPIQCVTGEQSIVESGKNIFDYKTCVNNALNADGTIGASNPLRVASDFIKIDTTIYSINIPSGIWLGAYFLYDENKNFIEQISRNYKTIEDTYTFTKKGFIRCYFGSANNIDINSLDSVQLEEGSTATTYEPYHTPITYPISLGNKQLYEDCYIVGSPDNWKFVEWHEKIALKDLAWIMNGTDTSGKYRYYTRAVSNKIEHTTDSNQKTSKGLYSNILKETNANANFRKTQGICSSPNGQLYVYIQSVSEEVDKTALVNLLTNTNAYAVIPLATPIETPITDETLISQLNAWYNAHSNNGTTIITSNGNLPMIIKVRALKGE